MEKFKLFHTVLYIKGWYKSRRYSKYINNNKRGIWYDLAKTLNADGYYIDEENPNKYDIVNILTINQERLPIHHGYLHNFINSINSRNTFQYGYYHKDLPFDTKKYTNEYDIYEAIASYYLSNWAKMEMDELPKPDFINVLPRNNNITNKMLKNYWND